MFVHDLSDKGKPRWYGFAYRDAAMLGTVCYPYPFNWIMRGAMFTWEWIGAHVFYRYRRTEWKRQMEART